MLGATIRATVRADLPVEHGATERPSAAGTTKEKVPDRVGELRGLGVGAEDRIASGAAERNESDLALGLATLNSRGEELAVRKVGARERSVVVVGAGLMGKNVCGLSTQSNRTRMKGRRTFARSRFGRPPVAKKLLTKATTKISTELSYDERRLVAERVQPRKS